MFNILQKWLTCKLGIHNCSDLNFNNVGKKFKDGFLFALLFQKYKVLPEKYVHVFKKTNHYDACLRNIKSINLWLQFMEIIIEDSDIYEIADGQSLAVSKLLYQLYFKLEMSKDYQTLNNISIEENQKLNNNGIVNLCKSNGSFLLSQQRGIKDKEMTHSNNQTFFHISKLFYNLDGIPYTAIDVLKSTNACKGNTLNMIQYNMNCFYDSFMMRLNNNKFFKNELIEKSSEILCRSTLLNSINKKRENNTTTDDKIFTVAQLDNFENANQNINFVSQDDLKNESTTVNSLNIEEPVITQSLDEFKNTHFVKQDIFNEYLEHTGSWSSEYLNVDSFELKQNILSMIIKEVLNFEYGISEIKSIKIKNTNVAGVIDVINSTRVIKLIKDNLRNKGILGFTVDDAISACYNAYTEEMKISVNKCKLYQSQSVEEYENSQEKSVEKSVEKSEEKSVEKSNITTDNSRSKILENNSDFNKTGKYLKIMFLIIFYITIPLTYLFKISWKKSMYIKVFLVI